MAYLWTSANKLQILAIFLVAVELIVLIIRAIRVATGNEQTAAGAALGLMAAGMALLVTSTEHYRAVAPPSFFNYYLLAAIFLDAAKCLCFFHHGPLYAGVLAALAGSTRFAMVVTSGASSLSLHDSGDAETTDPTSRSDHWGYPNFSFFDPWFFSKLEAKPSMESLMDVSSELSASRLHDRLKHYWKRYDPSAPNGLFKACAKAWGSSFSAALAFRFALDALSLLQPFALHGFLAATAEDGATLWKKLRLLSYMIFVICGRGVLKSAATHALNGLVFRIRGGLTCLVFEKHQSLTQADTRHSVGVKLLESDIQNVATGLPESMNFVSSAINTCLSVYSLTYFVGRSSWALLLPFVVWVAAVYRLGRGLPASFEAWQHNSEARIKKTSSLLGQLSVIKMIGLGPLMMGFVEKLYAQELSSYQVVQMVQSTTELVAAFVTMTAPAFIIGNASAYKTFTRNLSPAMVFATLNLVTLQTSPLMALSKGYKSAICLQDSFHRIQAFLALVEREDPRTMTVVPSSSSNTRRVTRSMSAQQPGPVIQFVDVAIAPSGTEPIMFRDVNFSVERGKIIALVSESDRGKSVLLETILGETEIASGAVHVAADAVGFSGHSVSLRNASIRDNVIGPHPYDHRRFKKVMYCSALEDDMKRLPGSDGYIIGIAGVNLTESQRRRVALARALFAHASIFLLDDIFVFLDRRTAVSILLRLLGSDGFLRRSGCTVILAARLVECFDVADHFLTLNVVENTVEIEPNRGQRHIAELLRRPHEAISATEATEEKQQAAIRRIFDERHLPSLDFDRDIIPHEFREWRAFSLFFEAIGTVEFVSCCGLLVLASYLEVMSGKATLCTSAILVD